MLVNSFNPTNPSLVHQTKDAFSSYWRFPNHDAFNSHGITVVQFICATRLVVAKSSSVGKVTYNDIDDCRLVSMYYLIHKKPLLICIDQVYIGSL